MSEARRRLRDVDRPSGAVSFTYRNLTLVVRVPDPAAAAVLASAYLPVRGVAGDVVRFTADPFNGTVAVAYAAGDGGDGGDGERCGWVMPLAEFTRAVASWAPHPPTGARPVAVWRRLAGPHHQSR